MIGKITKSVPNPNKPKEVIKHYAEHFFKWLFVFYKDSIKSNKRKNRFNKLLSVKNSRRNKIAFVLAGGPSINTIDPIKLATFCNNNQSEIFCVNYFVNSDFAKEVNIDNWVISDFNHFDFNRPDTRLAHKNANSGVCKKIFAAEQYANLILNESQVEIIPFNDLETSNIFSSNINPCFPRSYVSMTGYKALSIAAFMGFEKIYICGFDNTYIRDLDCDIDNKLYRRLIHFYSIKEPISQTKIDENRIKLRDRTVADELLAYIRLFSDLSRFKKFPIYNLDPNSLTDAFPKDISLDIYK
jgi:hypothetical protein